jgi:hypothetical protein
MFSSFFMLFTFEPNSAFSLLRYRNEQMCTIYATIIKRTLQYSHFCWGLKEGDKLDWSWKVIDGKMVLVVGKTDNSSSYNMEMKSLLTKLK